MKVTAGGRAPIPRRAPARPATRSPPTPKPTTRNGVVMLSELCVRRPVFATMLVTSLVVLGIFSFRDLGVDLFPRADPATVNVIAAAAGRGARRDDVGGDHADGERAQRHRRHRSDVSRPSAPAAAATINIRFLLERDLEDAANTRAREGGRRDAERAARSAAADHPEAGSGRRSDHEHRALGQERRACGR